MRLFQERPLIVSDQPEILSTIKLGSLDYSALVVVLQTLLEGPPVVLQSGGAQGLCHSLLNLLHILKTVAREALLQLGEHVKVA